MKPQNLFTKSQSCVELSQLNSCIASDRIGSWRGRLQIWNIDWERLRKSLSTTNKSHFHSFWRDGGERGGSLCVLCYFCLYWRCKTHSLPSRWSESNFETHKHSHAVRNTGPSFVYNTVYSASVKKCYLYGINVYQAPAISPRVWER